MTTINYEAIEDEEILFQPQEGRTTYHQTPIYPYT